MLALLATASCAPTSSDSTDVSDADHFPGSKLHKVGPVLTLGEPGTFDDGMVESPVVWYDETAGRYAMVYTAYQRIDTTIRGYKSVDRPQVGLAWSDDLINWERDPRNPIFGPSDDPDSPDSHGTPGPYIWHENGTYYLYYFGTTDKGYERGIKTMNMATSTDLVNWTRNPNNPIISPEGDGWRYDSIWHPNIVKVDGTYYMFFNAGGLYNGVHEEYIGYATSTDLFNWNVDDANSPILVGSMQAGRWDSTGRAGDPSLYKVGDKWYMAWYSWDRTNAQDGLSWTSEEDFPLNWRPYEGNPVLRIGAPGEFDALHAHKPFIFRTEDRHFHYYTAVDTMETRVIGLAVWPPLD
jgi:predicted GH43/DUF377 family glycosyl hydrolase